MSLTEEPQFVNWPVTHYIFVEGIGPFQNTAPQAWQKLHAHLDKLREQYTITGFLSLYKIGPQIYRAGVSLSAPPAELPEGFQYEKFNGGRYARFVLTGSYAQLPEASGRVWKIVSGKGLAGRDDFAIENYVNNPATAPEAELITEILVPTSD